MARGDGGKSVFETDADCLVFLSRLGEVCGSCGWRVHAWVLNSFELAKDGRGRRAYVAWLEARAAQKGGKIDPVAQEALRRGWYLGEDSFRDRLLPLVEKVKGIKPRERRKTTGLEKDYGERDAEQMIQKCGAELGLPTQGRELGSLRKGDERKALMAALLRGRTAVSTEWIAKRLCMGYPGSVSRQVGIVKRDRKLLKKCFTAGTDPR